MLKNLFLFLNLIMMVFFLLISCGPNSHRTRYLELKEEWDPTNSPDIFGNITSKTYDHLLLPESKRGFLEQKPWSDSYWPLYQAGLANRWLGRAADRFRFDTVNPDFEQVVKKNIQTFLTTTNSVDEKGRSLLSPVEKYDLAFSRTRETSYDNLEGRFPNTAQELNSYAKNFKQFTQAEVPWHWMGNCHGWALAAYTVPSPKTSVLYDNGSFKTFFSEGDIRGLITKIFAENKKSIPEQFIGTRCELSETLAARDGKNRIIDGVLGTWDESSELFAAEKSIKILYNNWILVGQSELGAESNIIVFSYEDDPKKYWLLATDWYSQKDSITKVEVRPMVLDDQGSLDVHVTPVTAAFKYQKSCRDLNPGALHLSLSELLSDRIAKQPEHVRQSFTIEVSRYDQVWNQPVYGYETKIGGLTDLSENFGDGVVDPYREFRAPAVKYLAHAYTAVFFGIENGPQVSYQEGDDKIKSINYQYTLEFDENKILIGGEWHNKILEPFSEIEPLSGKELIKFLQVQAATPQGAPDESPDFIWRYPPSVKITSECDSAVCLDANRISELHACSLKEASGKLYDVGGRKAPYVDCGVATRPFR